MKKFIAIIIMLCIMSTMLVSSAATVTVVSQTTTMYTYVPIIGWVQSGETNHKTYTTLSYSNSYWLVRVEPYTEQSYWVKIVGARYYYQTN